MKRNKADRSTPPDRERTEKPARTTILLPQSLNSNLEVLALQKGRLKGELIREALADYLRHQGLAPERMPSIRVSYAEADNASR